MALNMAAVAPAQFDRRMVAVDYTLTESAVDTEREEDLRIDYTMRETFNGEAQDLNEGAKGDSKSGSREDDDLLENEEDAEEVRISSKHRESDDEVIEEDLSEPEVSSLDNDHDTDKSSSDGESAVVAEWEGGSETAEMASVANRNNCVLVVLYMSGSVNTLTQSIVSAVRMRNMIQMKNLRSTWHVRFVGIIVSVETAELN